MSTAVYPVTSASTLTAADLVSRFGPIPLSRIRFDPAPGTATEQDVIDIHERERRLYELVDGILLEKVMGFAESILAMTLGSFLVDFLAQHNLGVVAGEGGMMRLASGLIRIPDVSFIAWERFPNRTVPLTPIPKLAPELAVEVLSAGNTRQEMELKLRESFNSGSRLVWFVDPRKRSVTVYTDPEHSTIVAENQTLDGGDVLPGFSLPLQNLFARMGRVLSSPQQD